MGQAAWSFYLAAYRMPTAELLPAAGRLIFMTFPGQFEGFFRILAERAGLETSVSRHTPGLTRFWHQLGRIAPTFPDEGLCSRTRVPVAGPLAAQLRDSSLSG